MKTWLKVQSDGYVINLLRQEEKPVDCELGVWMLQMHPFAGPGWRVEADGRLTRPSSFQLHILRKDAFIERFSEAEWSAVVNGAEANPQLAAVLNQLDQIEILNLQSVPFFLIIQPLVNNGILTEERVRELRRPAIESEEPQLNLPTLPNPEEAP